MPKKTPKNADPKAVEPDAPDLNDVDPGADADATPVAEPGKTSPDPDK